MWHNNTEWLLIIENYFVMFANVTIWQLHDITKLEKSLSFTINNVSYRWWPDLTKPNLTTDEFDNWQILALPPATKMP